MRKLDTGTGRAWQTFGQRDAVNRDYGSHALYDIGKILVAGGGSSAKTRAGDRHQRRSAPVSTRHGSMANGRRQHNLTVLADGTVAGDRRQLLRRRPRSISQRRVRRPSCGTRPPARGRRWPPNRHAPVPLHRPAVPRRPRAVRRRWHLRHLRQRRLPGQERPGVHARRTCSRPTAPAQLAPRPTVATAPAGVAYGAGFQIDTPDAAAIRKVALVRLGAVTHSVNMEQRYVPLTFTAGAGHADRTAPANANIAPPGVYMLFLVDANGVPSVAKMVTVGAAPPGTSRRPRRLVDGGGGRATASISAGLPHRQRRGHGLPRGALSGPGCTDFVEARRPLHGVPRQRTSAATTYRYRVRAADSAGNLGGYSVSRRRRPTRTAAPPGLVGAGRSARAVGSTTAERRSATPARSRRGLDDPGPLRQRAGLQRVTGNTVRSRVRRR